MQRLVIDTATGEQTLIDMTPEELAEQAVMAASAEQERQADAAARADLAGRRATIIGELQAIRDATSLAQIRGPLLRILVFVLRRIGERDS